MDKQLERKDRRQKKMKEESELMDEKKIVDTLDSEYYDYGVGGVIQAIENTKAYYKTLSDRDIRTMSNYIENMLSEPLEEEESEKLLDTLHSLHESTLDSLLYFKSLRSRISIDYIDTIIDSIANFLQIKEESLERSEEVTSRTWEDEHSDKKSRKALERAEEVTSRTWEDEHSDKKSRKALERVEDIQEKLLQAIEREDVNTVMDLLITKKVPLNEDIITAGLQSSVEIINELVNNQLMEQLSKGASSLSLSEE